MVRCPGGVQTISGYMVLMALGIKSFKNILEATLFKIPCSITITRNPLGKCLQKTTFVCFIASVICLRHTSG
jgi:hypothetical protein